MEEKKEFRIKLSTAVYLFFIFILVIALCIVYYSKNENNTILEENTTTNKIEDDSTGLTNIKEMNDDLAFSILKKYKDENLKDANWNFGSIIDLLAHGDNDTYLVGYEEIDSEGYKHYLHTIIQYKNGEWTTDLPGSYAFPIDLFQRYNMVSDGMNLN